ncbi:hypothetical protein ABW19_dt0204239 [Dactylella cylindrospora]|nr:hypothetical protein ABW19_dt0204239 [Dactylella cylindrospora]
MEQSYSSPQRIVVEGEVLERSNSAQQRNATESRLLLLPRELRDMIYDHLCEAEVIGNPNVFVPKCNGSTRVSLYRGRCKIFYPDKYPSYKLLALIHSCKVLRAEGLDYFTRLKETKPHLSTYKLELVCACTIWDVIHFPTWYHMVLPLSFYDQLESVDVEIRAISRDDRVHGFSGCGGVPAAYYGLFRMLNDFFFNGPQFYFDPNLCSLGRPFIKKFNLFVTMWTPTDNGYSRIVNSLNERLPASMSTWIGDLATVGYLARRVGSIAIHENGVLECFIRNKPADDIKSIWEIYGFKWGTKIDSRLADLCACEVNPDNDMGASTTERLVSFTNGGHIKLDGEICR